MAEDGRDSSLAVANDTHSYAGKWVSQFPATLGKRLILSFIICSICGGTSLYLALAAAAFSPVAVLLGSSLVALFYVFVTGTEGWCRIWRKTAIRRAIITGFVVRMFATIVFPIGMILDGIVGAITASLFGQNIEDGSIGGNFSLTFPITILHALFLNVIHWLLIALIYPIVKQFTEEPLNCMCLKCGYDLRASPIRCPECGQPNPAASPATALPV